MKCKSRSRTGLGPGGACSRCTYHWAMPSRRSRRRSALVAAGLSLAGLLAAAAPMTTGAHTQVHAHGCPPAAEAPGPSQNPEAGRFVIPHGPGSLLLCRYQSVFTGGVTHPLVGARQFSRGPTLRQIVRRFNALPVPPGTGATSCPADHGETAVAYARYADAPTVAVSIALGGCGRATNGTLARWAVSASGGALQQQIRRRTPCFRTPGRCGELPSNGLSVPGRVLLRSSSSAAHAPIGNACGRTGGRLGCNRAFFPGHPSKERLTVRREGKVGVHIRRKATAVVVRLMDAVATGGGPEGRVGDDLTARSVSKHLWRVRLPAESRWAGGLSVSVSYADGSFGTYYVRLRVLK